MNHKLVHKPFAALKTTSAPEPEKPAEPEPDGMEADDPRGRRLVSGYSRDQGLQILKDGSEAELRSLREAIVLERGKIQSQIDDEMATEIERRTELLNGGMHPVEAKMRAEGESDQDWLVRAKGALRALDNWLMRVSNALTQRFAQQPKKKSAVVVKGAGQHSTLASSALNALMEKGVQIFAFGVIGSDLVVVGSEPKS